MRLRVDAHSPIPIRWQLTEQLKHAIEGGDIPGDHVLPSIRELAGVLSINPNTVARAIEDLERSGHMEARRGNGVFVAPGSAHPPVPHPPRGLSEGRGDPRGNLEMTPDDAYNLEHSIANAALPDIARIEAGSAEGAALGRLVRRVDAIVCSTSAAERVQGLVGPHGSGDRRRPGALWALMAGGRLACRVRHERGATDEAGTSHSVSLGAWS